MTINKNAPASEKSLFETLIAHYAVIVINNEHKQVSIYIKSAWLVLILKISTNTLKSILLFRIRLLPI